MSFSKQIPLFPDISPVTVKRNVIAIKTARSGTFIDNGKLPIHRWFKYPAGFAAEWAEELIRATPQTEQFTVLDPFAGSGTTLVAAEKAGVNAVGLESHPFVCRIAEAKLLWRLDERRLIDIASQIRLDATKLLGWKPQNVPELLLRCFTPEVLDRLYALRHAYEKRTCEASDSHDSQLLRLVWLALTAILRPCSHVGTAPWQYILPNKRKVYVLDPYEAFQAKIAEIASDMAFAKRNGFKNSAKVHLQDARTVSALDENALANLVITSPPYPNNYDYADATRLEMSFWGEISSWGDLQRTVRRHIIRSCSQHSAVERLKLDALLSDPVIIPIRRELTEVCNKLADIRETKGGKKTYHTMVAAYFVDLANVFISLRKVCAKDAVVCFVVGDSAPYGVYVPTNDWLGRLALAAGFGPFDFEKLRDRNVKWKNRKHRVPLHEGRLWIKGSK